MPQYISIFFLICQPCHESSLLSFPYRFLYLTLWLPHTNKIYLKLVYNLLVWGCQKIILHWTLTTKKEYVHVTDMNFLNRIQMAMYRPFQFVIHEWHRFRRRSPRCVASSPSHGSVSWWAVANTVHLVMEDTCKSMHIYTKVNQIPTSRYHFALQSRVGIICSDKNSE